MKGSVLVAAFSVSVALGYVVSRRLSRDPYVPRLDDCYVMLRDGVPIGVMPKKSPEDSLELRNDRAAIFALLTIATDTSGLRTFEEAFTEALHDEGFSQAEIFAVGQAFMSNRGIKLVVKSAPERDDA